MLGAVIITSHDDEGTKQSSLPSQTERTHNVFQSTATVIGYIYIIHTRLNSIKIAATIAQLRIVKFVRWQFNITKHYVAQNEWKSAHKPNYCKWNWRNNWNTIQNEHNNDNTCVSSCCSSNRAQPYTLHIDFTVFCPAHSTLCASPFAWWLQRWSLLYSSGNSNENIIFNL